ncbi:hypothetical protein TSACC_3471 [Terrimicrobium sacchariphilum]|uniref:GYF domain-containing protein n=1 Tax=Terrimicrobium sacchariphilum TaxID=690879 RepID=A0A146GG53_TERSA|nr:hypothetical protein [Terrimicrobium sacchariphilum]GAT35406.1 hypothetical protein TSACC_3471 [Terrimicrobium sacchariphilum]
MKKTQIHIARNGQLLGVYDSDKISDYVEMGTLKSTDHFFDEKSGAWKTLDQWQDAHPSASARQPASTAPQDSAPKSSSSEGHSRRSSRSHRSKKGNVLPWLITLVFLCIGAGLVAWVFTLSDEINVLREKNRQATETQRTLKLENQVLNEVTPAGKIRGIITYSPTAGQVAVMSGSTVGLYPRESVEQAISTVAADKSLGFSDASEKLKSILSSPISVTITDSNGRVDMVTPAPGDYVLVASAAKKTDTGYDKYLWLIGFTASDRPSRVVLLNEDNAISEAKPELTLTDFVDFATK